MNVLKFLLSLLIALTVLADAELELAKKYFTEAEIEESLMWSYEIKGFFTKQNIEWRKKNPLKFFKNRELTGEVFAEIDDKGLRIGDEYVCNYEPYSDEYILLAEKYIVLAKKPERLEDGRRFFENEYSLRKSKLSDIERQRKTCDEFPVLVWGDPESITINFKLRVFDGKVARLKMRGQDVYFDVSEWILNATKQDTETILRRDLTPKEYEDFVKLIHELRGVIEKGSLEDIYNFVYERRDKENFYEGEQNKKNNVEMYTQLFGVKSKEEYFKNKMTNELRRKMIKSTFFTLSKLLDKKIERRREKATVDIEWNSRSSSFYCHYIFDIGKNGIVIRALRFYPESVKE